MGGFFLPVPLDTAPICIRATLGQILGTAMELSLEQQFALRSFESQVQQMSHEQAQSFLLLLYRQMIIRDAMYKELLKHEWRIDERYSSLHSKDPGP